MVIMFVLGAQRGISATVVFTSAVALAIAAIPEAMPTVLQVVMSIGAADLAEHGAVLKDLASVETLGSTSAINSDKTGTLTMNQMTAVEVLDPSDRYTISGSGYELEGTIHHAAGSSDTIEEAILPYVVASDATLVDGKVVGDPTEGALLVLAHKAGLDVDATRERYPRLATLPFDPTYKLMAAFTKASRRVGQGGRALLREGSGPRRDESCRDCSIGRSEHPVGRGPTYARGSKHAQDGRRRAASDGRGVPRPRPSVV